MRIGDLIVSAFFVALVFALFKGLLRLSDKTAHYAEDF